jgi:hypothetical protein
MRVRAAGTERGVEESGLVGGHCVGSSGVRSQLSASRTDVLRCLLMKTQEAVDHFGSVRGLANALGISTEAVYEPTSSRF